MKRLLVLAFAAAGLFFSCPPDFDDLRYTITNDSGKKISFNFNGENRTLPDTAGNNSINFAINSGDTAKGVIAPPENAEVIDPAQHPKSINMDTSGWFSTGGICTFTAVAPLDLTVENTLAVDIIIQAGDYIDAGFPAEGHTELRVPANGNSQAKIYTKNPRFTVNLPGAVVAWEIDQNAENKITAVIRTAN